MPGLCQAALSRSNKSTKPANAGWDQASSTVGHREIGDEKSRLPAGADVDGVGVDPAAGATFEEEVGFGSVNAGVAGGDEVGGVGLVVPVGDFLAVAEEV